MTDRFEEAVRDAVQGLPSTSGDLPTYHGAWQRGRRRRLIKRSALAAAGVVVVLAALTVNLGRLPGSSTTEIDDVVTGLEVATPVFEPTPLATTSPIETPEASAAAPTLEIPTPASATPPTTPPDDAQAATSATTVPAEPPPTVAAPSPTAAPTATAVPPVPTAAPTPLPSPTVETPPAATPDPAATEFAAADDTAQATQSGPDGASEDGSGGAASDAAGTAQQPPDPGSPDEPPPAVQPEIAASGLTADAVILGGAARGIALPCDLDGDGLADANCELLVRYACTGQGDIRPGYSAIDTDGDQVLDACVAQGVTSCDTNADGTGDTPCIIELLPPSQDSAATDPIEELPTDG